MLEGDGTRDFHAFCVNFTHCLMGRFVSHQRSASRPGSQQVLMCNGGVERFGWFPYNRGLLRAGDGSRSVFKMLANCWIWYLIPRVSPSSPRLPGPPHNPGLRNLVSGKRKWAQSPSREEAKAGFKGWHERGYIPHRDEPGLIQMVTFHVIDSFPRVLRSEWAALFGIEEDSERRRKLQAYLDKGRGECPLRKPQIAELVDNALRFHHDVHYELRAWVIMPNHLHVLFKVGSKPMGRVIADWKEYTAREANKVLGRHGAFWAKDYWDTYMRNSSHEIRAVHYAEKNPLKALLVKKPDDWPWSSARFRDKYGRLAL